MNNHYSDYLKKSVPVQELSFEEIGSDDKTLLKLVKKIHIKTNLFFLVTLSVGFLLCAGAFVNFLRVPAYDTTEQVVTLCATGIGMLVTGYFIYSILGAFKGFRKGVVLAASRLQAVKDNRNKTYQYVFDIYMEDRDESLMSYPVSPEVFSEIQPGDGVVILKIGRKIKVLGDPDRVGVMDVSKIRSGV